MSTFTRIATAAGIALAGIASAQAQTVFTTSTWVPPSHTLTTTQREWCDLLEKESAGRMKCNLLPKAPTAAPGTFDAVRDGLVDISFTVDGYTPGRFVFTQVAEFPFLGNSATATSVAYQRIYDKYFAPLGEHRGVKVLAVFTHGPGIIFTTKQPVTSAAEAATSSSAHSSSGHSWPASRGGGGDGWPASPGPASRSTAGGARGHSGHGGGGSHAESTTASTAANPTSTKRITAPPTGAGAPRRPRPTPAQSPNCAS